MLRRRVVVDRGLRIDRLCGRGIKELGGIEEDGRGTDMDVGRKRLKLMETEGWVAVALFRGCVDVVAGERRCGE